MNLRRTVLSCLQPMVACSAFDQRGDDAPARLESAPMLQPKPQLSLALGAGRRSVGGGAERHSTRAAVENEPRPAGPRRALPPYGGPRGRPG